MCVVRLQQCEAHRMFNTTRPTFFVFLASTTILRFKNNKNLHLAKAFEVTLLNVDRKCSLF